MAQFEICLTDGTFTTVGNPGTVTSITAGTGLTGGTITSSGITLDTSTGYNNSTNTASLGRITLAAGRVYKLTGSINNVVSASYNATQWYNSDTNTPLGLASGASSPISTTDRSPSAGTIAYLSAASTTRVEL